VRLGVTASRFGLCARGFVSAAGVFSLQIPAAAGLDTLDQHRFPGSGSPCGRGRRPPSVAATSSPDSCPNLFLKFFLLPVVDSIPIACGLLQVKPGFIFEQLD
jgi:hypothetical protein